MTKANKAVKSNLKVGDYVRVTKTEAYMAQKGTVGVVAGFEYDWDEFGETNTNVIRRVNVEYVDKVGDACDAQLSPKSVVKIPAPQYVVVWTNEYSDPFCQFETRAVADKFVKGLKKDSSVLEVRVYKLTK